MPSETTDAQSCQTHEAFCSSLLARCSRMVRRRGLRKLFAFQSQPDEFVRAARPGRILRRTAQSPVFASQSLLLRELLPKISNIKTLQHRRYVFSDAPACG